MTFQFEAEGVPFAKRLRDDLGAAVPRVHVVASEALTELKGRHSQWPARPGQTRNTGITDGRPKLNVTGLSLRSFRLRRQGRIPAGQRTGGQFTAVTLENVARNRSGRRYAGFTNRGITFGGRTVSNRRYRHNFDAVGQTLTRRLDVILTRAARRGR